MQKNGKIGIAVLIITLPLLAILSGNTNVPDLNSLGDMRVVVEFSGGHETNPVDHGRPVVLIAGALGVTPELFREAFRNVQPAQGGGGPSPERARSNKELLMKVLGPHGISNDRLDLVSNYYRYRPEQGERWPTRAASAYAILDNNEVVGFEILDGGSGYSSPPEIHIPGYESIIPTSELSYTTVFDKNGSVTAIHLNNTDTRQP